MSRPRRIVSLQSVSERFRRLPCLFIADMGIAHGRADILVAEQFLDFPQILSHLVKEDRCRAVPYPWAVISPTPRALHVARSRRLNARLENGSPESLQTQTATLQRRSLRGKGSGGL